MGYDFHIRRRSGWARPSDQHITLEQWHAVVAADPELKRSDHEPTVAYWIASPVNPNDSLRLVEGRISTERPDNALIVKMIELAGKLGAQVVGGPEEEEYILDTNGRAVARPPPKDFPRLTLAEKVRFWAMFVAFMLGPAAIALVRASCST
jgi:hypothetical protein